MFWLDPNTVPTMGDYFRTAGYQTYWQGKWHVSAADILLPGTHKKFLSYNPENGIPIRGKEQLYINANTLSKYGFMGWSGPEPFGVNPKNAGASAAIGESGRDVVYSKKTVDLIRKLNKEYTESEMSPPMPWFMMCSLVNPHDIALFGTITGSIPQFSFKVDPSIPFIPNAPTATESLSAKPKAQLSYKKIYPHALQPLVDTPFYRRLYYSLILEVDRQIGRVLDVLRESSFYHNTVVIFTFQVT